MEINTYNSLLGLMNSDRGSKGLSKRDLRVLINGILALNENHVVQDLIVGGLDKNLGYGVNVLGANWSGLKTIRLPFPPIKGNRVQVVNNTGFVIVIRPSVAGGSINGVVDGSASVPSDGKIYEFVCWENPLPGAWSWTPPATGQYDSGEIVVNSSNANVISASKTGFWISGNNTFYGTTSWGFDGINKAQFVTPSLGAGSAMAPFKPAPNWNKVLKLKVYTNLSAVGADVVFGLMQGSGISYYNILTKAFVSNGSGSSGNFGATGNCDQAVAGATLGVGVLTTNIGDPGTCYGEYAFAAGGALLDNIVGDLQLANATVSNVLRETWLSRYLSFCIQPNQTLTGLKVRFFIEYN
jgi:hypothetical protein